MWETRVQDYEVFAKETKRKWEKPGYAREATQPSIFVSWDDAQAFCAWLTERERKGGRLGTNERYRLPSDHEWSCAVGIGDREDPAKTPEEKDSIIVDVYPWGTGWPAPANTVNYAGREIDDAGMVGLSKGMSQHSDGHVRTAPAGSYPANALGLYDLAGNVAEFCEDWWNAKQEARVTRGGSWATGNRKDCLSSKRHQNIVARDNYFGFRCVLEPALDRK